jgi:hypothetical protein
MKLPRVRFTVRRMMIVVAVVAVDLAPIASYFAQKVPSREGLFTGQLDEFTNAFLLVGTLYLISYLLLAQALVLFGWLAIRRRIVSAKARKS